MSLPDGVTTCLLTYGPITDTFGNTADSITVEVVADRTIVHGASGRTLFKSPVSVTAAPGGVAQLPVPHTDQSGFRDQQQNALTGWYYTVRLTARFGNSIETDTKTFQPLVGQTTVDADLLPSDGMVTPGVTTTTSVVTSVAGHTGLVTVDQLTSLIIPDTGWRYLEFDDGALQVFLCRRGPEVEIQLGGSLAATTLAEVIPPNFCPDTLDRNFDFYDVDNSLNRRGSVSTAGSLISADGNPFGLLDGVRIKFSTSLPAPTQPYPGSTPPF